MQQRTLGVTLLEIMLVLAIAAMIIVMSVRYFQTSSTANQANAFITTMNGITAAADTISQASGTYASTTSASLKGIAGNGIFYLPWGGSATITSSTNSYVVTTPNMPDAVCKMVQSRMQNNAHYILGANCASYTYTP
jgi:type II secretory pathway pseudopilin PulG